MQLNLDRMEIGIVHLWYTSIQDVYLRSILRNNFFRLIWNIQAFQFLNIKYDIFMEKTNNPSQFNWTEITWSNSILQMHLFISLEMFQEEFWLTQKLEGKIDFCWQKA